MEGVLAVVDEGTETRALAATPGGDVLALGSAAGSANARFVGLDGLERRLRSLVAGLLPGRDDAFWLSASAVLHADGERVRDLLAELLPIDRERVVTPLVERCALAGSLGSVEFGRAVVVRADVGSRGWATAGSGREAIRGGFGEVLGDEGSACWIGRRGVQAALKAFEKRCRNTLLKSRLLAHFGVSAYTALLTPDHEPASLDRYALASFAPSVFECADQDDEVALEILEEAGKDLASMALALINELELAEAPFSVLPCGSVFRLRGACLEGFMKLLKNKTTKANLVKEGMGAAAGGVLLAIQHLGLKVRPETAEVLRAGLKAQA